jgi:hypothetical protein
MEVSSQLHVPEALPPGKQLPWNPLDGRVGGPQRRSATAVMRNISAPAGNYTRSSFITPAELSRFIAKVIIFIIIGYNIIPRKSVDP